LYHYAHFLCDALFPEVVLGCYQADVVIRPKNIEQTLGKFGAMYEDVMQVRNMEVSESDFPKQPGHLVVTDKDQYLDPASFDKFRQFIFARYHIQPNAVDTDYPEILLIKRGERISLLNDPVLEQQNENITTGKERREIEQIDDVERFLHDTYDGRFRVGSLFLENVPFEKQVRYFHNAKMIVCAHGAAMSNLFFCQKNTLVLEITCGVGWYFFDVISQLLQLRHYKCEDNQFNNIIAFLRQYGL